MVCPKCGSNNVNVQLVTEKVKKHHSIWYWLFIGWWLELILWLFLTLPRLIVAIFSKKSVTVHKSMAVCQSCGHSWSV